MTTKIMELALLNSARMLANEPGEVGDLARAWLAFSEQPPTYELQFDTQFGEVARTRISVGMACERACDKLKVERDEARREVCEMVANAYAHLPFVPRGPEHVARFRGWTGLYSKSASSALTGESDGESAHTEGDVVTPTGEPE